VIDLPGVATLTVNALRLSLATGDEIVLASSWGTST